MRTSKTSKVGTKKSAKKSESKLASAGKNKPSLAQNRQNKSVKTALSNLKGKKASAAKTSLKSEQYASSPFLAPTLPMSSGGFGGASYGAGSYKQVTTTISGKPESLGARVAAALNAVGVNGNEGDVATNPAFALGKTVLAKINKAANGSTATAFFDSKTKGKKKNAAKESETDPTKDASASKVQQKAQVLSAKPAIATKIEIGLRNDPNKGPGPKEEEVLEMVKGLAHEKSAVTTSKDIEDLALSHPESAVFAIDALIHAMITRSAPKVATQTAIDLLPQLTKLAPARVAKHLGAMTLAFKQVSEQAKHGLMQTFAALCLASVAYQKRLEEVLDEALGHADPKTLQRWCETILPALKGEPHARAKAVVERRLPEIPRPIAQQIAGYLGVKIRASGH